MRGVSTVVGGVLLVALLALGIALSAAVAARHAAVVKRAAVEALESASLRAVLEPLESDCSDGFLEARFRLLSSAPWAEELVVYGLNGSVEEVELKSGEAVLHIPCGEEVVLVVKGHGREWVYRFEQDPYNPCLTGCRVSGEKLLHGRDCLEPRETATAGGGGIEEAAREAARKVLGVVFSQSLVPVAVVGWGDGRSAVEEGLRPGVDVEVVKVVPLEEGVESSKESGEVVVDLRRRYPASTSGVKEVEVYSYRVGELEVGRARLGLLVEAFRVLFKVEYEGSMPSFTGWAREWRATLTMRPPLLRVDYDNDTGEWYSFRWSIRGHVEEAGAAAYVLVPFLVSRGAEPVDLLVTVVPLANATLEERYYDYVDYCPWYCVRYVKADQRHEQHFEANQWARVVVYVLDPKKFSWNTLVVERAEGVPSGWASRITVPMKTIEVWRGALREPISLRVRLDPSKIFEGLPREVGVVVAAVTVILGGAGFEELEDPADWAPFQGYTPGRDAIGRVHLYKVNGVRALVYLYRLGSRGGSGSELYLAPPGLKASGAEVLGVIGRLEPWKPWEMSAGGGWWPASDTYHGQYWYARLRVGVEAPYAVVRGQAVYDYGLTSSGGGFLNETHLVVGDHYYELSRVEVARLPTLLDEYLARGREVLVNVWPTGT